MTAFWNFVALGHQNSQMTTIQQKDYNSTLPGFKLIMFEPAATETDPLAGDTRQHLTQLFYKQTLPFQQIKITTISGEIVQLVFLKSQHSFRHTCLANNRAGELLLKVVETCD